MSVTIKSCYIRSLQKSLSNVYLPDNTPIFVGRSPQTCITDTKCSRQQVRLCAIYADATVAVQQIGVHACGFNGFKTQKDVKFIARHKDRLELLYGKHSYEIEFNPPPERNFTSKKRSCETVADEDMDRSKLARLEDSPEKGQDSDQEDNMEKLTLCNIHSNEEPSSSFQEETSNNTNVPMKLWESVDNRELLIYTSSSIQHRSKIASYDMDGTLIKTKSGAVFPKDCSDWQLLFPTVPDTLKQLHTNGYKVIIFTNQAGIGLGRVKIDSFKEKIEKIVKKIGIPMQVFIAVGKSIYRKPMLGMWELLEKEKNGGIVIDKANSFYVGDAAARPKDWAIGRKKDHSSADRLMALNINIKFETPEEHFLKHKAAPYVLPKFNPKNLSTISNLCKPPDAELTVEQQEIILMVGGPGSGKSHFAKYYLKDYAYVNRDTLRTSQKCKVLVERYLKENKSIVIDNTNPNPLSRQDYIEFGKKYNVPVRCFVMTTSTEHARHNNKFRELIDPNHAAISEIIIRSYAKNYVPPSLEEGFKEIVEINFIPKFHNEQDRRLYEMYLLEN